jgi:hypothetical protein
MKIIMIFYEHTVREYEACLVLKSLLEKNNYAKVYIRSLQYEVFDVWVLSLRKKIDCIVMPYVYSEKSLAPIKFLFKNLNSPLVVNLHHEQVAAKYYEHILLPRDNVAKHKVIHLVWTEMFKKSLQKIGVSDELIFITGNTRAEKTIKKKSKTNLANKYNLDKKKDWLLLCESGNTILSDKEITTLVEERGFLVTDLEDNNAYLRKTIKGMTDQLNALEDEFFEKYEIIYRAHPGFEETPNLDNRIKQIDKESVSDWFPNVAAVLSRISTVLHEAEKQGVFSVRYDPELIPARLLPRGLEYHNYINNFEAIESLLIRKPKTLNKNIYEKYIGKKNLDAPSEVVLAIKKSISSDYSNIKLKVKHTIWKRILCNIIARYIVKLKLKWNCSFCRSISNIYRDGPPKWIK